jgi:putative ABC transport system permease protein
MFRNYFKTAFRHLWKGKLYSFINIAGLSAGITCVLLAVLYVKDEHSFDRFHSNNPNLYRITTTLVTDKGEKLHTSGGTGQVQGPAFKAAVPEIKNYVRVLGGDIYGDVLGNDKSLRLQMLFTDESFFDVFSFELLKGDAATALKDIASVVVTETTALKYFNSINVIGKSLQLIDDPSAQRLGRPMQITAVVKDPPHNSSIRFDALFPLKFMQLSFDDRNWLNAYLGTYIVLHRDADTKKVIEKFNAVYTTHAKEQVAENKKAYGFDPQVSYGLQRMTDIHLNPLPKAHGNREAGVVNESNPVFSYMFLAISVFILLMAGINFINISIAGSLKRAKEVGVRKINGGSKPQIIFQFLLESCILCVIAFGLSLALTEILLPLFNQLSGKQIVFREIFDSRLLFYFLLVFSAIVLLTGLYPAYVLSGFRPAEVLYHKQKLSGRRLLGRSLVVIQFALAVFFIIATIVYYRQMDYIRTKDLGYNPHQLVHTWIKGNKPIRPVQEFLRTELAKEPSVKLLSFGGDNNMAEVKTGDRSVRAMHKVIDENYIPAAELTLRAGRNFSPDYPSDTAKGVIVNEAFVKAAGLKNPIGTQIQTSDYFDKEVKTITGVVNDFHFQSLRERIQPMVMLMSNWYSGGIWMKFEKGKQHEAIAALGKAYKKAIPNALFEYYFVDELNAGGYIQEQRWQKIIAVATVLSVIICCLGLFGLAHLAAQQRIKEIGIRKVLGAGVRSIASLLSKDFLKLVIIAFALASPVAWWVMNNWLQDFAYRVNINMWLFIAAGLVSIMIAGITVGLQAVKAAVANPVGALRSE